MTGVWVTADTITAERMNEKTAFIGTGAAISGLAVTYAGMLAFCTTTGSGFYAENLYTRNSANTAWSCKYELLDNHLASGTESTYTFTPTSALSFDDYSKFIVTFDGAITGTCILEFKINAQGGVTGFSNGWRSSGSALTNLTNTGVAYLQFASSTLAVTNHSLGGEIEIYCDQSGATNSHACFSKINNKDAVLAEYMFHMLNNYNNDTISSIEILTSTSTWKTGTRITIYGVRRN